ncbi:MAG: hypothetical protein ASARMPREDX12_003192 [Alectoria sarmentosa]|nr:MAG: hypothetical protein ASARMPREDX12_003192 [Alectoria sarmentosa]
MLFTSLLVTALAMGKTPTSSLIERVSTPIVDDDIILNFALTLEFLQRDLYEGALVQFTEADFVAAGFEDPFYANLKAILVDEESHCTPYYYEAGRSSVTLTNAFAAAAKKLAVTKDNGRLRRLHLWPLEDPLTPPKAKSHRPDND